MYLPTKLNSRNSKNRSKDGNKKHKAKDNLLTLCANCSRLYNKKLRTGKKSILNATVDGDTPIA